MGGFAALLVALGIIGLIWGAMQKFKAGRLASAPLAKTGDVRAKGNTVAGDKGAVSAEGAVKCAAPLISPVTGTPCLYYELKIVGSWKEGDSNQSKDYINEKQAAAFSLDDGSGPVEIDASKGGDFDPREKTHDETKKEGFFADLKSAVGKGEPMMFGKYAFHNPAMSKADKFHCTEYVVKVPPKMYAVGKHEAGKIISPSWTSLILTNKSREELMGSTAKGAKNFLMGGGAVTGVGAILGAVSMVLAPATPAKAGKAGTEIVAAANPSGDTEGTEVAMAPTGEGNAADGNCAKAAKCCKILAGEGPGAAGCDNLTKLTDEQCAPTLETYKKSVKLAKPKQAADCQ